MSKSLPEFIATIGDAAAAELFQAKLRTVQSWRRRERYPRAEQAQQIVAATDGAVDFGGIFGPSPTALATPTDLNESANAQQVA